MKHLSWALLLLMTFCSSSAVRVKKTFAANWTDLDTRPIPEWYDRSKIGIFLHWGVFSVPSFGSEWFWNSWEKDRRPEYIDFMNKNYPPNFSYQEFAPFFKAEFFDPEAWAELFSKAGARYVVLTSKHHEGYTLFPSETSFAWNSVDVGPKRDLVGDLANAVRQNKLKFGVYHSLYEWYNRLYLMDKNNEFQTQIYTKNKLWPDLKQLIYNYKPDVLWTDGDWEANPEYWKSVQFLAWLYSDSPVKDSVVVNDRWGIGTYCKHGDFYNCADRYNPGELQKHKWENAFTLDTKSWGYRRNTDIGDVLTSAKILHQVVSTVSCGGNVLINVGPTKDGVIEPIYQERLLSLGVWLKVNGEAIYSTSPWSHQNDSVNGDVWYTCINREYNSSSPTDPPKREQDVETVFAILLQWPENNILRVADLSGILHQGMWSVEILGSSVKDLKWSLHEGKAFIELPDQSKVNSRDAWTLKITRK